MNDAKLHKVPIGSQSDLSFPVLDNSIQIDEPASGKQPVLRYVFFQFLTKLLSALVINMRFWFIFILKGR